MATIEIPKVRKESTVIMYVSLTDNGVTVDWTSLSEIKPFMYSDEQHCIAGKCTAEIATGAPETLIVRYPTTAPQFLGQNSLLIRCTYDGNEKSFDVPVLEFVDRSSEATGVTVIEDPELPVAIEVQDVDTSVLDDAIAAALNAAAKATAAAELVPLDILAQCQAAAEAAEAAAENCAPVIGDNGNWWIYDYDAGEYVDSGKPSRGIQGEQGIQGIQGIQGNTGSSVDYPYELVNNRTTDDATKGLSAAEGKRLGDDLSQLDQEVTELADGKIIPGYTLTDGYSINPQGAVTASANYSYTSDIFVKKGQTMYVRTAGYSLSVIAKHSGSTFIPMVKVSSGSASLAADYSYTATEDCYLVASFKKSVADHGVYLSWDYADKIKTNKAELELLAENALDSERTANLFNDLHIIYGQYISNDGKILSASGWALSPLIPVTAGENYTISCLSPGRDTGINWYDNNGDRITSVSPTSSIYGTHTAPAGAVALQFNVGANNNYSRRVMVAKSSTAVPWVPYTQIIPEQIKGFDNAVRSAASGGNLSVVKDGNNLTISKGADSIVCKLEKNYGAIYNGNPCFNIMSVVYGGVSLTQGDEVAPLHVLNTTIGANHGQPATRATITAHGLTNADIGTEWLNGSGIKFYVMRIVDANNVIFLSENGGTLESPSFTALTTGNLTKGGNTLTVTAVTAHYLYPALKNHTIKMVKDGADEITEDGIYKCGTLDIVETYDIMNPASTLQKIIARAGQSGDPEYDGDNAVTVRNVFKFDSNLSLVVVETIIPAMSVKFENAMFSQSAKIGDNTVKYYIPNSLPLGNGAYDFRKPLAVSWSASIPYLSVNAAQMADEEVPVNRVLQYASTIGFALGFLTDKGVGKSLLDYTTMVFELRNDTGKIYPHGVNYVQVGDTLQVGQMYTAVMYRCFFEKPVSGNRMSMYAFELDGATYVFVDYSDTMLDFVSVKEGLNGKDVEVMEAVNCELKSDIYNDGFYVNATYVENETCYIVVKIS